MIKKPKFVENPDLSKLKKALQDLIDFWEEYPEEGCEDTQSDYEHPVMEEAIYAFFDDTYSDYIEQQMRLWDIKTYPEFFDENGNRK